MILPLTSSAMQLADLACSWQMPEVYQLAAVIGENYSRVPVPKDILMAVSTICLLVSWSMHCK